jgi:hypothetical protein
MLTLKLAVAAFAEALENIKDSVWHIPESWNQIYCLIDSVTEDWCDVFHFLCIDIGHTHQTEETLIECRNSTLE